MIVSRPVLFIFTFLLFVLYPEVSFAQTESDRCSRGVWLQVITSATNPKTGKCEEFPTSCVPEGWKIGCNDSAKSEPPIDKKVFSCLQYNPAKNSQTGECKTFACAPIPQGWVKVDKCVVQDEIITIPTKVPDIQKSKPVISIPWVPIQMKIFEPGLRLPSVIEQPNKEDKIIIIPTNGPGRQESKRVSEGIPILIEIPKPGLRLPVASVTSEPSSEESKMKENRGIVVELKTVPRTVVSEEEFPISEREAVQTAVLQKSVDLPREPVAPVELLRYGKEAAYKIKGVKQEKVFGLIPVAIQKDVFVSAKSGKVINEQMTFFSQLLDKLSF